ncbi:MAG: hypothetical protein AABZ60_10060 [Planctomycetota bacterium]
MLTLYLTQLAVGYLFSLIFIPYTLLGKKFFHFNLWLPLLLFFFVLLFQGNFRAPEFYFFGAPICLLLFYKGILYSPWFLKEKKQIFLWGATASAIVLLLFLAHFYIPLYESLLMGSPWLWIFLHFFSSALLMGSSLVAMILGHYYLVLPKLSFDPLKKLTRLFIFALVFRMGLTLVLLFLHWEVWTYEIQNQWSAYLLKNLHVLSLRFLAGLLVPGILAYMIWDCVQRKSNQSATGILYVACFLILMGEFGSNWYFLQEKILF